MLKAFIWVQYVRDNNATLVVDRPERGHSLARVFQSPDQLGMAASLQAGSTRRNRPATETAGN